MIQKQVTTEVDLIKELCIFFSSITVIMDNLNVISIKSIGESPIVLFSMFIFLFISFLLLLFKILKVINTKNLLITLTSALLLFVSLFIYKDFVNSDIYNIFLKLYEGKFYTVYGLALLLFSLFTFAYLNEKDIEAKTELYYDNLDEQTKVIEAELKVLNGIIAENEEKIKKDKEEETTKVKEENKQLREENKKLKEYTKQLEENVK